MASVSAPPLPSHSPYKDHPRLPSRNHKFPSPTSRHSQSFRKPPPLHLPNFSSVHRVSDSARCRCQNQSDSASSSDGNTGWNLSFQDIVKGALKRIEDYLNSGKESNENVVAEEKEKVNEEVMELEDWDWERWKKHFQEVDDHDKLIAVLKSQIGNAVYREEYEYASKLKVAMAAAATNDIVGRVVTHFNRAIEEERYQDAAFLRDNAGAGLMGWWAGISEDSDDPYGRIIHIGVKHGRYLARSFSPRHLATATPGVPLFEIFLTMGSKGEYKQQAVYLKRDGRMSEASTDSSKLIDRSSNGSQLNESTDVENERSATSTEDTEDRDDDSDTAEGVDGVKDILRDMMPRDVRVLKVTAPGKVAKDFISNFIEQIVDSEEEEEEDEEEDDDDNEDGDNDDDDDDDNDGEDEVLLVVDEEEENDSDLDSVDSEDDEDVKAEIHQDKVEIEIVVGDEDGDIGKVKRQSEIPFQVVIGARPQKLSSNKHAKNLVRVPARLEKKDRLSFSFSIEKDERQEEAGGKVQTLADKSATGQRSISHAMSDLAKFAINREKIPMKVLKDVEELISLTIDRAKNRQPLSGTTTFKRIEISASPDLLNGLYVGAHGLHTSEVIHLTRKFGQWEEDGLKQKHSSLEFYEYVEALKLTGDPHVPAGQVAFRAKVGKQYQLPHKGIIPEEFGVVARYKGQGRLAEPGFKNPRWVDGELVILDGKYIKGGPVVGFVYWAPDYHFLVFFNRVRLPE